MTILNLHCRNCRSLIGITTFEAPEGIYCLDCEPTVAKREQEKERLMAEYRQRMREAAAR